MKRTLSMLVLAVAAVAAFPSFAVNSPVFHSPTNGSNYIVYDLLKNSVDAKAYCISKQGHLAVINNHNEAVELLAFTTLLLPTAAISGDADIYYMTGGYVPATTTIPKTVTNQGFFTDSAYTYSGYDGTAKPVDYFLQISPFYNDFKYDDLTTTQTRRFICEFEDSPI